MSLSITIPYLKETKTGFIYYRRVPKNLIDTIGFEFIRMNLGKDRLQAIIKAEELNNNLALKITTITTPSLSSIIDLYCKTKEDLEDIKTRKYFFTNILLSIFGDVSIDTITFDQMLELESKLKKFPKRYYKKYKRINPKKLWRMIDNNTITIPPDKLISSGTLNHWLGYTKMLFNFATDRGFLKNNTSKVLKTRKRGPQRFERQGLTIEEYKAIRPRIPHDLRSQPALLRILTDTLLLSGLRRSELYKTKITTIEGIICFDLRGANDRDLKLKTQASYRIVPVHSSIDLDLLQEALDSISPDTLTRKVSKLYNCQAQPKNVPPRGVNMYHF